MEITRRHVLAGVSVAIIGSGAGCIGGDDGGDEPQEADFDGDNSDVDPEDINVPTMTFSFSHREEEGVVSVSHAGGRSVSVDNLYIRGEGIPEEYNETAFIELPDSEFSAGDNWSSGDSVTVEIAEDEFRVEVVWVDSETNYPKTVDEFSVGLEE